jgi:GntP family gluconate:H+ symporter
MNTWLIVVLAIFVVLGGILVLRQHAFLTLLVASLLVAGLTGDQALRGFADSQVTMDKMTQGAADTLVRQTAPQRLAVAFGEMAGKIGILIALASIIGSCLAESGGASVIVQRMLQLTGTRRAAEALAASSFVLGIPVFFDTVFYLMIPLARSLRRQTGQNYVLYICAIIAGGSIAHSLVPPTPGPLLVAGMFDIDIGTMILAGGAVGACTSVLSLLVARAINRSIDVPLRSIDGEVVESVGDGSDQDQPNRDRSGNQPSLIQALLPIVIPVLLIAAGSVTAYLVSSAKISSGTATDVLKNLGDKNIAIGVGAVLAMFLLRYCPEPDRKTLVNRSLSAAGSIILITCAGGAFGAMLRQAGIGDAVGSLVQEVPGTMLLPVAFLVTAAIRTLQGSATVAMITAAGVLQGIAESQSLPFHPVYLALAIGVGSKPISWMNDSGFWVVTRMSGMTDSEGLRVVSPMLTAMGFCGLAVTMLFAILYPAI